VFNRFFTDKKSPELYQIKIFRRNAVKEALIFKNITQCQKQLPYRIFLKNINTEKGIIRLFYKMDFDYKTEKACLAHGSIHNITQICFFRRTCPRKNS